MLKEIDHFDNVGSTNLQKNPRTRNDYKKGSKLTALNEKKKNQKFSFLTQQ